MPEILKKLINLFFTAKGRKNGSCGYEITQNCTLCGICKARAVDNSGLSTELSTNAAKNNAKNPLTKREISSIILLARSGVKMKTFTGKSRERGTIIMAKDLRVALLLDFYGDMLTEKQRDFLEYYYNEDLSLAEIAVNEGISRQGVRDAIKRAESALFDMESRLELAGRFESMRTGLEEIIRCAGVVHEQNKRCGLSREINEAAAQISATAERLMIA